MASVKETNGSSKSDDHNQEWEVFIDPEASKRPVAEADYQEAVGIIKAKLPDFAPINVIFEVSLGDEWPTLTVDATKQPPEMVDHAIEGSICTVATRPETIARIIEGQLEPRYGVNFGHIIAKGAPWVAVKFGDLLLPKHLQPLPPAAVPSTGLPKPTEDIAQVRRDLRTYGYGLVKNALQGEQLERLRRRVKDQAAGEKKAGCATFDGGPMKPNQRVWNLLNKGQEFVELLDHPIIDEFLPEMLGEGFHLSNYLVNIARPGGSPMFMHYDQMTINPPIREVTLGANVGFFLQDVTEENGGTRVIPGSHKGRVAPGDLFDTSGTVAVEGPAGTGLIFDSRLWHCTGANNAPSGERPVVFLFFVRYFVAKQENLFLSLRESVLKMLSESAKAKLGYRVTGTLGGTEGFNREGTMVQKLEQPIGILSA